MVRPKYLWCFHCLHVGHCVPQRSAVSYTSGPSTHFRMTFRYRVENYAHTDWSFLVYEQSLFLFDTCMCNYAMVYKLTLVCVCVWDELISTLEKVWHAMFKLYCCCIIIFIIINADEKKLSHLATKLYCPNFPDWWQSKKRILEAMCAAKKYSDPQKCYPEQVTGHLDETQS